MRAPRLATVLVALLALGGCGKSDLVAVKPPILPIYLCTNAREHDRPDCKGRFNAGRLIGLPYEEARRVARAHGFGGVKRGAPLTFEEHESDTVLDNGIRVECDGTSGNSIVIRVIGVERF